MVSNPETLVCNDQKHRMEIVHEYELTCIQRLLPFNLRKFLHDFTKRKSSYSPLFLTEFRINSDSNAPTTSYVYAPRVPLVFHGFIYNIFTI